MHSPVTDLPNQAARDNLEMADTLIKASEIRKAKCRRSKSILAGRPARMADLAEDFRPKDGPEVVITEEVKDRIVRITVRRALRTAALAVLRLRRRVRGEFIPGIGFAADMAMSVDSPNTISEFKQLKIDADAAIDHQAWPV